MHSVLTLLFAAFMMPQPTFDTAPPGDDQGAPAFCAEVQPFTAFTIADDGEEEFVDGLEMGCTESDGGGPLDVDALVDAT